MGKIVAYCREGCPYSINTKNILIQMMNNYSLNFESIEIIDVSNESKVKQKIFDDYSNILNGHNTFPIVLYKRDNGTSIFVGGNNDFEPLYNKINEMSSDQKYNQQNQNLIKELIQKISNESNESNLIQLNSNQSKIDGKCRLIVHMALKMKKI